jgi:hypothetical protein
MSSKPNQDDIQLQHREAKSAEDPAETIEVHAENKQTHGDKAAQFLEANAPDHDQVLVTPEDNKRVLRKIDLALLPILLCKSSQSKHFQGAFQTDQNPGVYFLQSLDKTALSYAAVFGLIEHTNLVNDEYSWLGAIVYVAQLVWQPVVAYFLVKLPTGKFLAVMVFCW